MGTPENDGQSQAFEMGRLVQGFTAMQSAVARIESKVDSQPTKADLEPLWLMARKASEEAQRANTRIDGFKPWIGIVGTVLAALILWGLSAIKGQP